MTNLAIARTADDEIQTVESQIEQTIESVSAHMQTAKKQQGLALNCLKKSVEHVWLMGEALTKAKKSYDLSKEKGKPEQNWQAILKQNEISVASDNRARRLFKAFESVEEFNSLTIMEAYQIAGISKVLADKPTKNTDGRGASTSNSTIPMTFNSVVETQSASNVTSNADSNSTGGLQLSGSGQSNRAMSFLNGLRNLVDVFKPANDEKQLNELTDEELAEAMSLLDQLESQARGIQERIRSRMAKVA